MTLTTAAYLSLPLAHAGHWYWIVIFMLPALLVLAGAIRMLLRERRRSREAGGPEKGDG